MAEKQRGISQEILKLIACVTMLFDHVGSALFPEALWMRVIGRIAFPIYCFLLVEGVHHTRHPARYGIRLAICMLLAEVPFDLALPGGLTWEYQNVMLTLLLAYLMLQGMKRIRPLWGKVLLIVPFAVVAELLRTDYGALGIGMVAVFMLTRENPHRVAIQAFCLCLMPLLREGIFTVEPLCIMALLPIEFYSGRKLTHSRWVQWGFYLFYPVHLAIIALVLWLFH